MGSLLEFEIKVIQGVQVYFLEGKLWGSLLKLLKKSVQDLANQGDNLIIFDLSKVEDADSAGLGFLIGLMTTLESAGGRLAICNVQSSLEGVLGLMSIPLIGTVDEALADIEGEGKQK
jgi:stage II sporulation protein AA (anti-sigma F factor antagonist)